jgi:ParB-like chromosome segregation protein Spo0J
MPPLTPDERAALKESIRKDGVLVPVEKDEYGNILDGFNRDEIWRELRAEGVKLADYPVVIRPGLSDSEKRAHARALNLTRRHLNREQRREIIEAQLKETPEQSDNQIAAALGVTDKTVAKRRQHLESTSEIPKLERTVGADGKSRPARRPAIFAKDGKEAKRACEALGKIPAEVLPAKMLDVKRMERISREHRTHAPVEVPAVQTVGAAELRFGDLEEALAVVPAGSAHLILTDPPYVEEMMDAWPKLATLADRILRDDGLLLCYTGQWYLPRILNELTTRLDYHWAIALIHTGPCGWINFRHFQVGWKPVIAFTRGGCNRAPRWAEDVVRGSGAEKGLHEWQQGEGEAATLIEKFTDPGDLVVDPFLGSGTTAAAAVKLGRRFIGCDINPGAVSITQERLAALGTEAKTA